MMKNKAVKMLLSLVIAFGLWLFVITVDQPNSEDTFTNIPVVLENESALTSRGLMITSEETPMVTLRLTGKRTELNKLSNENLTVRADLSKIYDTGRRQLQYNIYLPEGVSQSEVELVYSYPSLITVTVERRVEKQIPVQLECTGSVPENYKADREKAVMDYAYVTAVGPASVMERIHHARISVDLEGQTQTIVQALPFEFCDANNEPVDVKLVETNVAEIILELPILRLMEIKLDLNVTDGGGATRDTSSIDIQPKTIIVSGYDDALRELEAGKLIIGSVNLAELQGDEDAMTFPITLPAGLTNESGMHEATVTISFPELKTKTFTVSTITPVNVPAGMKAEIVTMQLDITVRGKKNLIDKLTAEMLSVTVDLSQAAEGTSSVKGTLQLPAGYESVGAMNSLALTVTLRDVAGN